MNQDIFKELKLDHEVIKDLMKSLIHTKDNSEKREPIFNELKHELKEHAKHEKKYFYKPLLDSDTAEEKARRSIAEHKELDHFLDELSTTDINSGDWLEAFKKLEKRLLQHLDEEEKEIFELAEKQH